LEAIDMESGAQNSSGTEWKAVFREAKKEIVSSCQKHFIVREDLKIFNSYINIV
jgi:hypothetical protein